MGNLVPEPLLGTSYAAMNGCLNLALFVLPSLFSSVLEAAGLLAFKLLLLSFCIVGLLGVLVLIVVDATHGKKLAHSPS